MEFLNIINPEMVTIKTLELLPKVIAAALVWIVFWMAYKASHIPLKKILTRAKIDPQLIRILVDNLYRFTLFLLGGVMAVSQLGVDVGAALAGIGVVGVAVGFAAQDTLSNIIAGFMIFWDKPFQIHDWIAVKGMYGRVAEITIRSTRIRTPNNTYIVIPNKIMVDEAVVNHSKHGDTRVDVIIGIAYKEYIPTARKVLLEAISDIKDVLSDPPPEIVVKEIADSSINLLVKVWIKDAASELAVFYAVNETCKLALDKAGIEIPFPHMQLFVDDVKGKIWKDALQTMNAQQKS